VLDDMLDVSLLEAISQVIEKVGALGREEYDDVSLLLIDIPEIYAVHAKGILMGGTTRLQEQNVNESMSIHDYNSLIKII
jgi:hypothetical protein